jgi:hypothetical protein
MNLGNKSFKNTQTGEIVRIKDSYQNIAITETNERIDANRLLDNRFYTEYVDPKSFFTNDATYNLFAEKIKNVDLSKIPEDRDSSFDVSIPTDTLYPPSNESAVVAYDPEEEKAELIRKYGAVDDSSLKKQQEAFSKILADDGGEVIQVNADRTPQTNVEPSPKREVVENVQRINVEDPIITMFRNAKKNVEFSFDLKVDGKIPRLDFIEMMEDSYEISMIEFLAEEFTNDLLDNPAKLKMKIINELKRMVYPNQKIEKPIEVIEERTILPVESSDREKLNEGVDKEQPKEKPKTTRTRKKQEVK